MSKVWAIKGLYSATFLGNAPTSYEAGFSVESMNKPLVTVSVFNPNTSYPYPDKIKVTNYGTNLDVCNLPLISSAFPDGNMWLIASIQTDSNIFGVLLGGATQSKPYISASWNHGQFFSCRCSGDSCRVDCANSPDGFCCIDHAVTNRLLQVLAN